MILNVIITLLFGYWLITKDYTESPKWVYYGDGFCFAFNFAIVFKYLTDMIGF
jgi:uncharacterized membrane protein